MWCVWYVCVCVCECVCARVRVCVCECVPLFKQLDYKSKTVVAQDAIITAKPVKAKSQCYCTQEERQYNKLSPNTN